MRTADQIHFDTHRQLFKDELIREYGKIECDFCHKHKPVTKFEAKHWDETYHYCKDCETKLQKDRVEQI